MRAAALGMRFLSNCFTPVTVRGEFGEITSNEQQRENGPTRLIVLSFASNCEPAKRRFDQGAIFTGHRHDSRAVSAQHSGRPTIRPQGPFRTANWPLELGDCRRQPTIQPSGTNLWIAADSQKHR